MDTELLLFVMILGFMMILALNWIYFFDWMRFLGWILKIISPNTVVEEIVRERKLRSSKQFIAHQRKWKCIFLGVPVAWMASYLIIAFTTKNVAIAFLCGMIIILILYDRLSRTEKRERERITT